jgi:hypothetical protein
MHPQRGYGRILGSSGSAPSCGVAASIAWNAGQEDVRINMVRHGSVAHRPFQVLLHDLDERGLILLTHP